MIPTPDDIVPIADPEQQRAEKNEQNTSLATKMIVVIVALVILAIVVTAGIVLTKMFAGAKDDFKTTFGAMTGNSQKAAPAQTTTESCTIGVKSFKDTYSKRSSNLSVVIGTKECGSLRISGDDPNVSVLYNTLESGKTYTLKLNAATPNRYIVSFPLNSDK